MIPQSEVVLLKLREMILNGHFQAGEHLMEVPLAALLEVSRTPVRLALGALAQEGLLRYTAKSGFIVRGFSVQEIIDAVAVRARLEAMACSIVASTGLSADATAKLHENVRRTEELSRTRAFQSEHVGLWCELNGQFHELIVSEAENETLTKFVRQFATVPMAAARTSAATLHNLQRLGSVISSSLTMHRLVLDAIEARQPDRAEYLMREHVYQGQMTLQRQLQLLAESSDSPRNGTLKLVAT